ncbi:tetratricopeptide repeat-containing sulfotransferase family protein [Fimbriiglobus ruber]|uniref:TPR repeat n=1 Tax=Fimbriiglobus ruber TaxID=1908690 RepID=A0A225DGD6_9BACT|nr:tetratricopeptide repeat-containing sulfotransferase family protein [Fimbriiglobus ruber]OWK40611.1 TPR repeat [Fimbriiglobus ruber]
MQTPFATAVQLLRAGRRQEAAAVCEKILAADRGHSDAAHLLGVLRLQDGAAAEAATLIEHAVAVRSDVPDYYLDLAEAYRASGRAGDAVDCCQTALRLRAADPAALNTLGLALLDAGRPEEAIEAFRKTLDLRPDFAPAHNNLGVALRASGRPDSALEHFRRAAELAPDFAPGRANLGRALLNNNRPEEALPHNEAAARQQPNADTFTDLANVLWALKKVEEAVAKYLDAIRLGPDRAVPHANLGRLLRDEGRTWEAISWLKTATRLAPENVDYWDDLAGVYWANDGAADAMAAWERVLALAPRRVAARTSLGWALQEDGRQAEAAECYRLALGVQPDYAPAHLNTGVLHEEKGEMTEAEAAYREAIRLQPSFALAHSRLATLLRGRFPAADQAALDELLASPNLGDEGRARLLFATAHVADAQGDAPRAAECLRTANALCQGQEDRKKQGYKPAEHDRYVGRIMASFGPEWFARTAGAGSSSRRPVFIFGLPRSGTTLVEQILASHPAVHGAGELSLARRGFESLPTVLGRTDSPFQCLSHLDSAGLRRFAEKHLEQLQAIAPAAADRVVDKMPDNYLYPGWLVALFPNATFIHCHRDLRDIALSCWMTDFRSLKWTNSIESIAGRFRAYRRLMGHWEATCPVTIHRVRYEDTVADLESVARRIIAACGLDWNPACLEFHRSKRTVRTASVTQVRQPIFTTSVARWKRYEPDLAALFDALPEPVDAREVHQTGPASV